LGLGIGFKFRGQEKKKFKEKGHMRGGKKKVFWVAVFGSGFSGKKREGKFPRQKSAPKNRKRVLVKEGENGPFRGLEGLSGHSLVRDWGVTQGGKLTPKKTGAFRFGGLV